MNDTIFVALSTFAAEDRRPLELLKSSGFPFRIHQTGKRITSEEILRDGIDAQVIIAGVEPYDALTLAQLPSLRCISRCGVGVDSIDLPEARRRGIVVSNTPGIPTEAVAELALSMMLALSRDLIRQTNLMKARKWERITGHLLEGRSVGIVGLGSIGTRVAKLCQAFNAHVYVYDPLVSVSTAQSLGVTLVNMEELLHTADIVSLHASKNLDQPLKIGATQFASMKQGAIIINLARGEMIDEFALLDALKTGHIAGAGLDVFSEEPYTGPLCDFEQVILTPHSATLTVETRVSMEMLCVENAIRFLEGKLTSDNDKRVI